MLRAVILLALLTPPALAQSGSATLDAARAACGRLADSYPHCHVVEWSWAARVARRDQFRVDAENYAGAEPPELRDGYRIQRWLDENR